MLRALLKVALVAIFCSIAFFLVRFAYTIISDDIKSNEGTVNVEEKTSANISAKVGELEIVHNITIDGKSGMYFYFEQSYQNLKGTTCYYMIRFFDEEGHQLKGKQYQDEDGYFAIIGKMEPDDNDFENAQRPFIAYDQFDVPDKGTVYFFCDVRLFILDKNGKRVELAHSNPSRFHLSY